MSEGSVSASKVRLLTAAILLGTFLVPVNSTMITVGLGTISHSFGETLAQTSWIITIYLIVMAATQPVAGKLGDIFGYKRMFLTGIALSLAGAVLCAFAFNLPSMIVFRSMQALGGALALPSGTALIRHAVPKEQMASVFGLFGLLMGLGAAVGPLAGSFLIEAWGWQAIFWINLPFLLASFLAALFVMPATPTRKTPVDLLGSLYLALGLSLIVLFITHAETIHWWSVLLLLGCLVLFFFREKGIPHPLIEFGLFRSRSYRSANLAVLTSNFIMYGTILVLPLLLQERGVDLRMIGTLMFVYSLAMSFSSWLGGQLSKKLGHAKMIGLAFGVQLLSALLYLGFAQQVAIWYIACALLIGGLGSGAGLPAMQTASLEAVSPEKTGVASGVFSTFRYMGSMVASALTSLMLGSLFYVMIGVAVAGMLLALQMKNADQQKALSPHEPA
ncbi:EmrB/QacA subfamily drug resistance transporter [Tumebacillus sp. BK434]|uniref:MFS transporter n=1 Tax=Tumebacillus sp. BK434 TaxID=2512169 RepID=UPI0010D9F8E6|nr:MFS transporter [Tumebacillus sp. BK434]TCP57899.1 EmrB/QacA subfamily drug resistance transporter [Tumebacillus sp. BK434]